eukprot:605600-Amphidinium_carterae.1
MQWQKNQKPSHSSRLPRLNKTKKRMLKALSGRKDREQRKQKPRAGRVSFLPWKYPRAGQDRATSERRADRERQKDLQKGWAAAKECDSGKPLKVFFSPLLPFGSSYWTGYLR